MAEQLQTMRRKQGWWQSGEPWVWVNAAAVSVSMIAVIGLLVLLLVNGFAHFWPRNIANFTYQLPGGELRQVLGQIITTEEVTAAQIRGSGVQLDTDKPLTT